MYKLPPAPPCVHPQLCGYKTCGELSKLLPCASTYCPTCTYAGWCDKTCGFCTADSDSTKEGEEWICEDGSDPTAVCTFVGGPELWRLNTAGTSTKRYVLGCGQPTATPLNLHNCGGHHNPTTSHAIRQDWPRTRSAHLHTLPLRPSSSASDATCADGLTPLVCADGTEPEQHKRTPKSTVYMLCGIAGALVLLSVAFVSSRAVRTHPPAASPAARCALVA